MKDIFVAGYENGMIWYVYKYFNFSVYLYHDDVQYSLFKVGDGNPIRRLYDLKNLSCVLSVSWMKSSNEENGEDIMFYAMFKNGKIRFWDFRVNQETQNHVFEKILTTNNKITHAPCCAAINSLISMSNTNGNHQFSVHRISA